MSCAALAVFLMFVVLLVDCRLSPVEADADTTTTDDDDDDPHGQVNSLRNFICATFQAAPQAALTLRSPEKRQVISGAFELAGCLTWPLMRLARPGQARRDFCLL